MPPVDFSLCPVCLKVNYQLKLTSLNFWSIILGKIFKEVRRINEKAIDDFSGHNCPGFIGHRLQQEETGD